MVPSQLCTHLSVPVASLSLVFSVPSSRAALACRPSLTLPLRPSGLKQPRPPGDSPASGGRRGGGSDPAPARRGNPPQSEAYVHRAGCAPGPGGPRALRSAACCRRSAGATPIRCHPTGKATGSRWTAGCPSSARRLDAWGSAWPGGGRRGSRRGTAPLQATGTAPARHPFAASISYSGPGAPGELFLQAGTSTPPVSFSSRVNHRPCLICTAPPKTG